MTRRTGRSHAASNPAISRRAVGRLTSSTRGRLRIHRRIGGLGCLCGAVHHLRPRRPARSGRPRARAALACVNLDEGSLEVCENAVEISSKVTIGEPKSDRSTRIVYLGEKLTGILRQHRTDQATARLAAPEWADGDLVFTDEAGQMIKPWLFHDDIRQARQGCRPERLAAHPAAHERQRGSGRQDQPGRRSVKARPRHRHDEGLRGLDPEREGCCGGRLGALQDAR